MINVDSSLYSLLVADGRIEDPYGTLKGCIIFFAGNGERGSIGIYKDGQIVWHSDTLIGEGMVSGVNFFGTTDINRDGKVDIITSWYKGQRFRAEYLWIFSWDGRAGVLENAIDETFHQSVIEGAEGSFEFVDINGDDIMEIVGISHEDQEDSLIKVVYSWNGQLYGKWSDTPRYPANGVVPRNRVDVEVQGSVVKTASGFEYRYVINSRPTSRQDIDQIVLDPIGTDSVESLIVRPYWYFLPGYWSFLPGRGGVLWVIRPFPPYNFIDPGQMDSTNFTYRTWALPMICSYYVRGHNGNNPMGSGGLAWYNDVLTNSAHGFTVGAADPPKPFVPLSFLDTLVSYKHQCVSLGWLIDRPQHEKDEDDESVDEGIVERLDRRLSKAREGLLKGDSSKARKELEKFLDKVEKLYKESQNHGQKGEKMLLSSEGYALLRYNAEYLKEHLNVEGEPAYDLLPRNRAQVSIQVEVTRGRSGLEYHYYVTSSRQSTQEADEFYVDRRVEDARTISAPSGWSFSLYPRFLLGWVNREESATYIHPGELRVEFACVSAGLPVIANYYVRGHNGKAPQVFHGEDVWYSDLTGNSAKGRTLGAAVPEQPLNPSKFLDGIIRQLQEAESLGWVRSGAIARAMEQKLRNVRAVIRVARGYGSGARLLGAMLEDLESQQHSFSTEGYALVKYNVEYLRDWLESHG